MQAFVHVLTQSWIIPTLDKKSFALRAAACAISTILPLSLVIFTHQRELIPLYGSGPTSYILYKIAFVVEIEALDVSFSIDLKKPRYMVC